MSRLAGTLSNYFENIVQLVIFQDWDPKDSVQNASEAMGLADDWLSIPQLIKPEEIVNPNIDEQSMMTYLSQYPNAKIKQGAPLRPRTSPNK